MNKFILNRSLTAGAIGSGSAKAARSSLRAPGRKLGSLLGLATAMVVLLGMTNTAHADLLTYFNFEDSTAGTGGNPGVVNLVSDGGQSSTITTTFVGTNGGTVAGAGIGSFGGTAVNSLETPTTNLSLAVINQTNNGQSLQFGFNTLTHNSVVLTYSTQRTGTGFNSQQLAYSTDGTTFTNFGTAAVPGANFAANGTTTYDLSGVTDVNNQANLILRLTFTGASSASGNNRIDNIQVNAAADVAPVPEPSTVALFAIGLMAVGFMAYRKKQDEGVGGLQLS